MLPQRHNLEHADLKRLHRVKQDPGKPAFISLGPEMLSFFKSDVQKKHTKLGAISECWTKLIPETMLEHCALEGFSAGTLKVIVHSSSLRAEAASPRWIAATTPDRMQEDGPPQDHSEVRPLVRRGGTEPQAQV